MTTLGALSVGLLVLVLAVAVGIGLLARSQRRSSRGPEQPRTVADLVRMREAAAAQADGRTAPGVSAADVSAEAATPAPGTPGDASRSARPAGSPTSAALPPPAASAAGSSAVSPAAEEPSGSAEVSTRSASAEAPPAGAAPEPSAPDGPETPDDEAPDAASQASGTVSLQDTPWARAARMADPHGEWTASARAAREREATSGPRPLARSVPKARTPEKPPATPTRPRLSLLNSDRAPLRNETTTIANLPQVLAQAAAGATAPEPPPPSVEPEAPDTPGDVAAQAEPTAPPSEPEPEPEPVARPLDAQPPPDHRVEDETVEIRRGRAQVCPDDSATVDFARGVGEPCGQAPAVVPPEEPTAPIEPMGSAAFWAAPGGSAPTPGASSETAHPAPQSRATRLAAPVGVLEAVAPVEGAQSTNGKTSLPTPARVAGRIRRSPADTAAEQAAADLALLRTFGVAGPGRTAAADDNEVELEGCGTDDAEPNSGVAQPVAFRVMGRDGRGLVGASVTLLDDHGREIAGTAADERGAGTLTARRPGGYMLVTAADGYQPGAVAIAVADVPVDTEIPLTRSASITGSVSGEDGPVVGAQLVLVQDGEIVDTAESGADGAYRFVDLAAGEYGLSVTASECEPAAVVLRLRDEANLRHDVDLDPVGLPADGTNGDVMIGHL